MAIKVIKYEAEWCGPCSQQSEILEDFDAAPVETIDIDEEPQTAREDDVRGIPTLVIESNGEEVDRFTGVTQATDLQSAVEQAASAELREADE